MIPSSLIGHPVEGRRGTSDLEFRKYLDEEWSRTGGPLTVLNAIVKERSFRPEPGSEFVEGMNDEEGMSPSTKVMNGDDRPFSMFIKVKRSMAGRLSSLVSKRQD